MAKLLQSSPSPDYSKEPIEEWNLRLTRLAVDATFRWRIEVTEQDVKNAVPADPCNCAIARAALRQGALFAVIADHFVYVQMREEEGSNKLILYRFFISRYTRSEIDKFDDGGGFNRAGYLLVPPRRGDRIEVRRLRGKKFQKKKAARANGNGNVPKNTVFRDRLMGPRSGRRKHVRTVNGVMTRA